MAEVTTPIEPPLCSDGNYERRENIIHKPLDASIEPPLCSDGNIAKGEIFDSLKYASIEPPLCSDGNAVKLSCALCNTTLASIEPPLCSDGNGSGAILFNKPPVGFNRATAMQRWKFCRDARTYCFLAFLLQ